MSCGLSMSVNMNVFHFLMATPYSTVWIYQITYYTSKGGLKVHLSKQFNLFLFLQLYIMLLRTSVHTWHRAHVRSIFNGNCTTCTAISKSHLVREVKLMRLYNMVQEIHIMRLEHRVSSEDPSNIWSERFHIIKFLR